MLRLLGLLGGLSAVTDLGAGAPMDESLRRCVVGARLARAAGCPDDTVRDVVYVSLLEHLGCFAPAYEATRAFGDDISVVRFGFLVDDTRPADLLRTFVPGVSAASGRSRLRTLAAALDVPGSRRAQEATCEVARQAAGRLGLGAPAATALAHVTALWNGRGVPPAAGADIPLASRVMHVAGAVVLFEGYAGRHAALEETRRRAGRQLDPEVVGLLTPEVLEGLDDVDLHRTVLDLEPDPVRLVDASDLLEVARTFGDLVDLKSPVLHGHSSAVARLATTAGSHLALPHLDRLTVAAHLHDVGRAGVSGAIWGKRGPLTASELDQWRLHPYYSERVLSRVPGLADVALLAAQHHERCDGSGYPRGARATDLSLPSRVLAAADRYCSLVSTRPGASAATPHEAARELREEARSGQLDADAVGAVLQASAGRPGRPHERPSGAANLTPRQVEVLRLVASGCSNREIADRLVISRRTAEHHVQDIYQRTGAGSRAGVALYAMEHGLVDPTGAGTGRPAQP